MSDALPLKDSLALLQATAKEYGHNDIFEHAIPCASALSDWRKSSHSDPDQGDCVEVVDSFPAAVPVRDSKVADGPALVVPSVAWSSGVYGAPSTVW